MGRSPCCDKVGLNKGTWSVEEDAKLLSYVLNHGHHNWRALPKLAGLLRCGKSCRLRWFNYLRPDIKRGHFTREEEETIINLHSQLGNKWSKIASCLPGRTDNEIKNVWNTYLKKRAAAQRAQLPASTKNAAVETPSDSEPAAPALVFEIPLEASIDDVLNSLPCTSSSSSSEAHPESSPCSCSSSSSRSSSCCKADSVAPENRAAAIPPGIPELDPIWKFLEEMEEEFEVERAPMGGGGWLDYLEKELGLDEDAVLDPAAAEWEDPISRYFDANKSYNFFPY